MITRIANSLYLVTSIAGALLIACNLGYNRLGYCLFLVSALSSIWLLSKSNATKSLWIVAIMFAIINVIGIISYNESIVCK
jgi:hypothetical protein